MRKETKKPQSSYAVAVVRDRSCEADVQAARISIITDENHLAGVTVSRAALESLRDSIDHLLRDMDSTDGGER